jgi:RimJ/RimL family protein N-acetyltransferase
LERNFPPNVPLMLGGFRDDRLVGLAGLNTEGRGKKAHKLVLVAVYVEPESRGLGLGRALVRTAIDFAFRSENISAVRLTVTDCESTAVKLYSSLGFETWGCEPEAICVNGVYYSDLHMQVSRHSWMR